MYLLSEGDIEAVDRTDNRLDVLRRNMGVDLRRPRRTVPQQDLDKPQVRAIFEKMRRKGMPQRMRRGRPPDPRLRQRRLYDRIHAARTVWNPFPSFKQILLRTVTLVISPQ